jgi:hypothetical protein
LCFRLDHAELRDATADTVAHEDGGSGRSTAAASPQASRTDSFDTTTAASSTKEIRIRGYSLALEYGHVR